MIIGNCEQVRNCRGCKHPLPPPFLDLGLSPLSNLYLNSVNEIPSEEFFPLAVSFCSRCYLMQLTHHINPVKMFTDYAYYSSVSPAFLEHAYEYVEEIIHDSIQDPSNLSILEIASNDGYLLQYAKKYTDQILGVEPAQNIAEYANSKGIPTINNFFNKTTAYNIVKEYGQFNIIIGNNVLAHVPEINEFIKGVELCLRKDGSAYFEFPYLMPLATHMEFDTIYHEHVFYYSIISLQKLFARHNLSIYDVKFTPIHGGSIRIYVMHKDNPWRSIRSIISYYEMQEYLIGMNSPEFYKTFSSRVYNIKSELIKLLVSLKEQGKTVAAYGAPAKGNTLLNACGLTRYLVNYTVDMSPYKQNKMLPGTHINIFSPNVILERMPDYLLILSWNFIEEIIQQQKLYLERGGKFILPIPAPRIIEWT